MRYNVVAQDANLNKIQLFNEIDENFLDKFLRDYCTKDLDPFDMSYRWLIGFELPEYGIPYRVSGWIMRFDEAEIA